eukprot:1145159-Pelagomonas_calceolata.AAC.11
MYLASSHVYQQRWTSKLFLSSFSQLYPPRAAARHHSLTQCFPLRSSTAARRAHRIPPSVSELITITLHTSMHPPCPHQWPQAGHPPGAVLASTCGCACWGTWPSRRGRTSWSQSRGRPRQGQTPAGNRHARRHSDFHHADHHSGHIFAGGNTSGL